jgi:hypothetical protein
MTDKPREKPREQPKPQKPPTPPVEIDPSLADYATKIEKKEKIREK